MDVLETVYPLIDYYICLKQVRFIRAIRKRLDPWHQIYILFGYLTTQIP